jgi:hypothetical protein
MPPLPPLSGKKGTWEHQFDVQRHLLLGNGGDPVVLATIAGH